MCIMIGAAAASTISAVSAIAGIAGTVAGIAQAQQQQEIQQQQFLFQHQMQVQQMDQQYRQQQRQVQFERRQQVLKHIGDVKAQQASALSYQKQVFFNSEAANRVYTAEQLKLNEARAKAAFKSQEIYAKQIGAMGKVLASGATGQSVGLLTIDSQRQAGFAEAEQNATLRSAELAMASTVQGAANENMSANNQALAKVPAPVQAPLLSPDVSGIGKNLNLGIPSYNWGI